MGVHGLWRLLDSFGQVARPEDWAGRRVAIDASIWIAQFRAKTEIGEDVERRVLVGFFARILKLLFYNIEAVFVFDGPASTLKTAEQRRRGQRREAVAQAFLRRRARQIMMAQIAAGVLDVTALPQKRKRGDGTSKKPDHAETTIDEADSERDDEEEEEEDEAVGSDEDDVASSSASSSKSIQQQEQELQPASHVDTPQEQQEDEDDEEAREQQPQDTEKDAPHEQAKKHSHRHHRRALAPAKVSAALTANFLDRAREQLSEYEKGEQRLMYNLLRHSSTSLFMGPRRVIEAEAGEGGESADHAHPSVVSPQPAKKAKQDAAAASTVVDVDSASVSDASEDAEVQLVHTSRARTARQQGEARTRRKAAAPATPSSPSTSATLSGLVPAQVVHAMYQRAQPTPSPPRNTNGSNNIALTSPVTSAAARKASKRASSSSPSPPAQHTNAQASQTIDLVTQESAQAAHSVSPSSSPSSSSSTSLSWASVGKDEARQSDADGQRGGIGSSAERETAVDDEDDAYDSDEKDTARNDELLWNPSTQLLQLPRESRSTSREPAAPSPRNAADAPAVAAAAQVETGHAPYVGTEKMKAEEDDYTPVKGFAPVPTLAGSTVALSSSPPFAPAHGAAGQGQAAPAPSFFASVVHHGEATRRATVLPPELTDIVLLLESCGLSYVVSPAESDAQCAFLARHGLVDAVFTEDSDVVVHGSPVVLRGFFSTAQQVVEYRQSELAACGMDKRVLVALAMLLGCDYVEGVAGMGLVSALDAIAVGWDASEGGGAVLASTHKAGQTRRSDEEGDGDAVQAEVDAVCRVLTRWRKLAAQPPRSWVDADDTLTLQQYQLLDHYRIPWAATALRPSFPERRVVEAFYTAAVDNDTRPFPPLAPEWNRLRLFAGSRGLFADGWLAQRFELARRECDKRAAAAQAARKAADPTQRKLTDYGVGQQVRERWAFKKLHVTYANALSHLRAAQHMSTIDDKATRPQDGKKDEAVVETKKADKTPQGNKPAARRKVASRRQR